MKLLRRKWLIGALALVGFLVLLAPTIISRTGVGRDAMIRAATGSCGVPIKAESIVLGWSTPLKMSNVAIGHDTSENHVHVAQIITDLTIFDLLGAGRRESREWKMSAVRVGVTFNEGSCDLFDDLNRLFKTKRSSSLLSKGQIRVQDIEIQATDAVTGGRWAFSEAEADINWQPSSVDAAFAGGITDSSGAGGGLDGTWKAAIVSRDHGAGNTTELSRRDTTVPEWRIDLTSDSIPISIVSRILGCLPNAPVIHRPPADGSVSGTFTFSVDGKGKLTANASDCAIHASIPRGTDNENASNRHTTIGLNFGGTVSLTQEENSVRIVGDLIGRDLAVSTGPTAKASTPQSPSLPDGTLKALTQKIESSEIVWTEPNLGLKVSAQCDIDQGHAVIDSVRFTGDLYRSSLSGVANWSPGLAKLKLSGQHAMHMGELASRLEAFLGVRIELDGVHQTPVQILVQRNAEGMISVAAKGQIGWDSGELGGMKFGPASVPVRLNDKGLRLAPTVVAAGDGQIKIAGEVRYRPGTLSIHLVPGKLTHAVQITPEITDRWLRFIAPPVADVRGVDGKFDMELDEGTIVPGQPLSHRVKGRLRVRGAELTVSPMIRKLMIATKRKLLRAQSRSTRSIPIPNAPKVAMPSQTIEFDLAGGVTSHKKIIVEIDGEPIVLRGDVALDNQLDMIARVPLDAAWLDPELRGKPGQVIELPVHGTIFHPEVDRARFSEIIANIVSRTVVKEMDRSVRTRVELGRAVLQNAKTINKMSNQILDMNERLLRAVKRLQD